MAPRVSARRDLTRGEPSSLTAYLREMSGDTCICVPPAALGELHRALNRNAAIIEGLPGGAEAARALRAIPSQDGVRFDCSPG